MRNHKTNARAESAAPTELLFFVSVFTQGFISGFALIPPWALQECRAYGTRILHFKSSKFETYFNIQK